MKSSPSVKIIPWLFMLVFVPVGFFCIQHGIREQMEGKRSLSWPTTRGVIVSVATVHSTSSNGRSASYSPSITYEYTVGAVRHTGSRIRFAAIGGGNRNETKTILGRYPVNRVVEVHYNPRNPAEAVLEPGAFGRSWGLIAAGIAFAGFGLLVWFFRRHFYPAGN